MEKSLIKSSSAIYTLTSVAILAGRPWVIYPVKQYVKSLAVGEYEVGNF